MATLTGLEILLTSAPHSMNYQKSAKITLICSQEPLCPTLFPLSSLLQEKGVG